MVTLSKRAEAEETPLSITQHSCIRGRRRRCCCWPSGRPQYGAMSARASTGVQCKLKLAGWLAGWCAHTALMVICGLLT